MFCNRPIFQVSVYRTISPLVVLLPKEYRSESIPLNTSRNVFKIILVGQFDLYKILNGKPVVD